MNERENNNLDLRIKRTHKLLFDALVELMSKKSFSDIKISDICEIAMIHRTTFYKHFEDKYNLLEFFLNDLIIKIDSELSHIPSYIENPREYYKNFFRVLLEHMHKNKKIYSIGLNKEHNINAVGLFQKAISRHVRYTIDQSIEYGIKFSVPKDILCEFFSSGMLSIALWWLNNPSSMPMDELIIYLEKMIQPPNILV